MKELNPAYDGKETHQIEKGQVTGLMVNNTTVNDISPVRALVKLKRLICGGRQLRQTGCQFSPLTDLTPLQGLPLEHLDCGLSEVWDLSPLRGMPLNVLNVNGTKVADLKPLQGMRLTGLFFLGTQVSDLSPLRGMPLANLQCSPPVRLTDLSPLKDSPLKEIRCEVVPKRDTQILRSIKTLEQINGTPVAEFWKQVEAGKVPPP